MLQEYTQSQFQHIVFAGMLLILQDKYLGVHCTLSWCANELDRSYCLWFYYGQLIPHMMRMLIGCIRPGNNCCHGDAWWAVLELQCPKEHVILSAIIWNSIHVNAWGNQHSACFVTSIFTWFSVWFRFHCYTLTLRYYVYQIFPGWCS